MSKKALDILVGLQWGDEGKGKIVDFVCNNYDVVARFQGGPNAGHTIIFNNKKFVLHTIPSGIFNKQAINIIGCGVAVDPCLFINELNELINTNLNINILRNLYISGKSTLIIPTHKMLDKANESIKETKIGSTLKGIGPAYTDKVARKGIKIQDIFKPNFKNIYANLKEYHQILLKQHDYNYQEELIESEEAFFKSIDAIKKLQIVDSEILINKYISLGKKILAEGAQGSLLDTDYGSYPFVTSSNTISASACIGLGVAPTLVNNVIGIFKAYSTRVGEGPLLTEIFGDECSKIQELGQEFGATTGRLRRVGWLDIPSLKYAITINGIKKLILTKADVLSHLDKIPVCTKYITKTIKIDILPPNPLDNNIKPEFEYLDGWKTDLTKITSKSELPANLIKYIQFIEQKIGIPINYVSVGPSREQIIKLS